MEDDRRYSDDGSVCLVDVCRGIIQCMVYTKFTLGRYNYPVIPKHHVRRIAAREAEMRPLRDLYTQMERKLRELQMAGAGRDGL